MILPDEYLTRVSQPDSHLPTVCSSVTRNFDLRAIGFLSEDKTIRLSARGFTMNFTSWFLVSISVWIFVFIWNEVVAELFSRSVSAWLRQNSSFVTFCISERCVSTNTRPKSVGFCDSLFRRTPWVSPRVDMFNSCCADANSCFRFSQAESSSTPAEHQPASCSGFPTSGVIFDSC